MEAYAGHVNEHIDLLNNTLYDYASSCLKKKSRPNNKKAKNGLTKP